MQTSLVRLPGHTLREYQVIVTPQEALRERIMKKRAEFREHHGSSGHLPPACLCIARFHQYLMNEDRTIAQMDRMAMGMAPFRITIRGFNSLPDHAIFFHTERSAGLHKLAAGIKALGKLLYPDPDHKAKVHPEPHIVLARRLDPEQFAAGWGEWAARPFSADILAESFLVLKRIPGDIRAQVVSRSEFKNLPVATRQGELFP